MTATQNTKLASADTNPAENQPQPRSEFLTEPELLARIPVCRRTLYSWVQSGKLPVVKINRRKIYHWPSCQAALLRLQRNGLGE
jgi:hypothetical protein